MSFDLAVLSGKRRLTHEDAADAYERLCDEDDPDVVEPDERIDAFVEEVTGRWPEIDDLPEEEVDDSPWTVALDRSPGHVLATISWDRVDEVAPVVVEVALKHGLHVYDPQEDELHAPPA